MRAVPRTRPDTARRSAPPAAAVRDLRTWFTTRAAEAARADLAALLDEAAALDLDDPEAVTHLRERAHRTTASLAASGRLPGHLVVARDDPGVLVVRTLRAASRGVTPTPPAPAAARPASRAACEGRRSPAAGG